jgi:pyruvate-ferredoxin/flavodoxin oxidoreductase
VGINDDVTFLSLPVGPWLNVLPEGTPECMFYGLGSDGTVGANKSAVKMIAMGTQLHAQAGLLLCREIFQDSNLFIM